MSEFQVMPVPRSLSIAITGKCNLRCKYCFYADEMVALGDLPTADWLNFFDELGRIGVMNVSLTGGEVFTRPDLFQLIDGIVANRMRYDLLTNGTLITEKTLQQFEIGKRRLRLDSIQISIDGSQAEVHDKSRPNSFERALRGLKLLNKADYPMTVRVTINRHNFRDLENIARLLLEEVGLPNFSTSSAMPMGAGCNNQGEIALTPPERLEAMHILQRLNERYPGQLVASAGPQAEQQMQAEMETAKSTGVKTTRWQMGYLTSCGTIFSKMDIMHDGTMVPCHVLHNLHLGNIKTDSLQEIWLHHPTFQALRQRREIPMTHVPGCAGCEWTSYCNGGCPGMAYELTGDFNRSDPITCYSQFLAATEKQHVNH